MAGFVGTAQRTQVNNAGLRPVIADRGSSHPRDTQYSQQHSGRSYTQYVQAGQGGEANKAAAGIRQRVRIIDAAAREKKDKKFILRIAALAVIGLFVLIGMRCYCATIQHSNNVLEERNSYLQAEIDSLQSQIVERTKVTTIERLATEQYGMVYPTPDNCIRLSEEGEKQENLAASIRSEAYN